tara:strand:+ start:187 stop:1458 length:1272 start_codon:yes stop_codon:yes gene_type:complete
MSKKGLMLDDKKKRIHKKKWERCVKDVKKKSPDVNPYAICTASIGYEGSILKPHRKKDESVVKESIEFQDMTLNIVNDIINIINRTQGEKSRKEYYLPEDGETYDEQDVSLTVELTVIRNENIEEEFNLDTYYIEDEGVVEVLIELNPNKEPRSYNHLYYYLVENVRHEIRHDEQDLEGKDMGGKGLKYYKKDFEVDAQTSGLNLRSFVQDKSHEDTIKSAVRNTVRRRGLPSEDGKELYDTLMKDMEEKYGETSLNENKIISLVKEKENPRMTKKKLMEYIKSSKKVVKNTTKKNMIKEHFQDFDVPEGFSTRDLLFVVRYLETIRRSGLTNMYEVASLLNWTKSDLERWLYGQSKDLDSLEDDDEIEIIEKLIEEKDAVRDALIRTAIKKAENSGNYSDKTIQRYFERAANDAFGVFIKIR